MKTQKLEKKWMWKKSLGWTAVGSLLLASQSYASEGSLPCPNLEEISKVLLNHKKMSLKTTNVKIYGKPAGVPDGISDKYRNFILSSNAIDVKPGDEEGVEIKSIKQDGCKRIVEKYPSATKPHEYAYSIIGYTENKMEFRNEETGMISTWELLSRKGDTAVIFKVSEYKNVDFVQRCRSSQVGGETYRESHVVKVETVLGSGNSADDLSLESFPIGPELTDMFFDVIRKGIDVSSDQFNYCPTSPVNFEGIGKPRAPIYEGCSNGGCAVPNQGQGSGAIQPM